jgi:hypothetical protein
MSPVKPRSPGTIEAVLTELYAAVGGNKRVPGLIQAKASQVAAYADPDLPNNQIKANDLVSLAIASRSPIVAEFFADIAGGYFTPGEAPTEALAELMARDCEEHGHTISALARMFARHRDGGLTATESRKLRADVIAEMRVLSAMRNKLEEGADV